MKASPLEPTRSYHPYHEQSFSEEVDSQGGGKDKQNTNKKKKELDKGDGDGDGDGATIELAKRPRGRPPGSKNKPKPPLIITREDPSSPFSSSSAFRPHILEIAAGRDVAASLAAYSLRSALGLCVLSATGPVADVTLRQPAGPAVTFRGRFDILSISAALFPPAITGGGGSGAFSVSLAGPNGQIVGGLVAGPLVAAGTVVVVAAGFANPTFHRLPAEDGEAAEPPPAESGGGGEASVHRHLEEEEERDGSDDRSRDRHDHHQQEEQQHQFPARRGPAGAPPDIYGGRFSPDIVWPPTARRPPPPY